MLFNSLHYLIFLPIVVGLYYLIPHRWRWLHLLAAVFRSADKGQFMKRLLLGQSNLDASCSKPATSN